MYDRGSLHTPSLVEFDAGTLSPICSQDTNSYAAFTALRSAPNCACAYCPHHCSSVGFSPHIHSVLCEEAFLGINTMQMRHLSRN